MRTIKIFDNVDIIVNDHRHFNKKLVGFKTFGKKNLDEAAKFVDVLQHNCCTDFWEGVLREMKWREQK